MYFNKPLQDKEDIVPKGNNLSRQTTNPTFETRIRSYWYRNLPMYSIARFIR